MSRAWFTVAFLGMLVLSAWARAVEPYCSPSALALSPDRRLAAVASPTSDSLLLVDCESGHVLSEHHLASQPADVAWADSDTVLASLPGDDALAIVRVDNGKLTTEAMFSIGESPLGIAAARTNSRRPGRVFVALAGDDQVAVVDPAERRILDRIEVGPEPCAVTLAPNGLWLLTVCEASRELLVHDVRTRELLSRRALLDDPGNLGLPAVLPDSSACVLPHMVKRTFPIDAANIEKGWVIDNRLSRLPLPDGASWDQRQMGLDVRGDAVGDAYAAAVSDDGTWLVVTCGGTHELLIFRQPGIPWPPGDAGDFIPPSLLEPNGRFRRLELGGRPMEVAFLDEHRVVITNYLSGTLQFVDVAAARLVRTIRLGGATDEKSELARRGEAIFYDADRSLNGWFSCHTCHTDGHTSGLTYDTLNDGSYNTPKLTPSLFGVTRTSPWTWHGWQDDLDASVRKSLMTTLHTKQPITDDDVAAVVAYLGTLEPPVLPGEEQLSPSALKGRALFHGKAGCVNCHAGLHFTSTDTFDIGLGSPVDAYPEYNPPSLRGLSIRRRYLHDGRATDLEELLIRHHAPQSTGGEMLDDAELESLLAYLRTL